MSRQAESESDIGDVNACEVFLIRLENAKPGDEAVSLVLLDPLGYLK